MQATYHSCDVADREALARVLEAVRRADGPIEGILHGAGIERSCRFERKNRRDVLATFAAKVEGARNLLLLTRDDPLRHFIAFGSVSGRVGSNGQADYAAASDMLCKLTAFGRALHPGCRAVGFHYHPWAEIGMAARPETPGRVAGQRRRSACPPTKESATLCASSMPGLPEPEVVITTPEYRDRFYGGTAPTPPRWRRSGRPTGRCAPGQRPEPVTPAASPERIANRYVLRAFSEPLESDSPSGPPIEGSAFILGENRDAQALAERLAAHGVPAAMIPANRGTQEAVSVLERLWASQPAAALFLMTGRDPEAARFHELGQEQVCRRGVLLPYHVTQRWLQLWAKLPQRPRTTIVAAVSLGGDFGCSGQVAAPESGALAGMLKSLHVEDANRGDRRCGPR